MRRVFGVALAVLMGLGLMYGLMVVTLGPYTDGPPPGVRFVEIVGRVVAFVVTAGVAWRLTHDRRMVIISLILLPLIWVLVFLMPSQGR